MGLGDQLDEMRVSARSPNGEIWAELTGRRALRLEFMPGYYDRTSENALEGQLAALCRLLWVARTREAEALVSASGGETLTPARVQDPAGQAYFQGLAAIEARGGSADGSVSVVATHGMREWQVRISDGTLRRCNEAEFAARAAEAADSVVRDQLDRVRRLRVEVYRPELLNSPG
ncbi:hypothetical protein Cs7R123_68750 [Catellatospora sp. TT07R-123]|uniref:hypothetical protein n=1 Tax=Catellatospora sp. TT07R-123 TaxID=2733863 RepID=UPI001B033CE6|nr:hypothetical protein [Catellatospora sp. TT07R-123]GHJ49533.1 hypothetical protein Cs7R123_68750 [Catellatospora sp. TT07R-123]